MYDNNFELKYPIYSCYIKQNLSYSINLIIELFRLLLRFLHRTFSRTLFFKPRLEGKEERNKPECCLTMKTGEAGNEPL